MPPATDDLPSTINENPFENGSDSTRKRPSSPRSPTSPGAPEPDDAMDVSPTTTSAVVPPNGNLTNSKGSKTPDNSKKTGTATGAAAAVQNPKVVQTAFVHKLYNMLEDQSIQHLITWSASNESFLMSPSSDFSKVLSTYFKHTNVSSFVRQLNMYGFHKVSDVFHTGSPETPLWEFKHGGGSFKKGDLDSLRDIKRRASRHTLIHRDSFSTAPKQQQTQPPPLPEAPVDSTEARLDVLERNLIDMHGRLARSEEQNSHMASKYRDLSEKLSKSYQHNQELSGHLASLVDDTHPVRRSISMMQNELSRDMEAIRAAQNTQLPQSSPYGARPMEMQASSPAPLAYDDRRRASIQVLPSQTYHRPLAPSTMRHDSVGTSRSSPVSGRLAPPPPGFSEPTTPPVPNQAIPSVAVEPPMYIPRRHTSADTHSSNNWAQPPVPSISQLDQHESQPTGPFSSYSSGYIPLAPAGGDRQLQDKLASYSFGSNSTNNNSGSRQRGSVSNQPSRGSSPPPLLAPPVAEATWGQPPPVRMAFRDVFKNSGITSPGSSSAPTRRSSMANIHNMLNPADTVEAANEDELGEDPRKRKRMG